MHSKYTISIKLISLLLEKLKFEVSVEEIQNLVKWFTQPKHRPDKHIYYPTQV